MSGAGAPSTRYGHPFELPHVHPAESILTDSCSELPRRRNRPANATDLANTSRLRRRHRQRLRAGYTHLRELRALPLLVQPGAGAPSSRAARPPLAFVRLPAQPHVRRFEVRACRIARPHGFLHAPTPSSLPCRGPLACWCCGGDVGDAWWSDRPPVRLPNWSYRSTGRLSVRSSSRGFPAARCRAYVRQRRCLAIRGPGRSPGRDPSRYKSQTFPCRGLQVMLRSAGRAVLPGTWAWNDAGGVPGSGIRCVASSSPSGVRPRQRCVVGAADAVSLRSAQRSDVPCAEDATAASQHPDCTRQTGTQPPERR